METQEHTFPIPEIETHKLDEIRSELPSRSRAYVTHNTWMLVGVSALAGCIVGLLWPRRHDAD